MDNRDAPNGKEIEKDSSINETWDREVAVTRILVVFWLTISHCIEIKLLNENMLF